MDFKELFDQHGLTVPAGGHCEQLDAYVALLLKWNKAINLIGRSTTSEVTTRHVLDSAQVADILPEGAKTVLDVGAGAGLPSVILAILKPEIQISACEINGKKSSFIDTARRELGLENLTVLNEDVKQLDLPIQDVITARAFAELKDILDWTAAYVGEETTFVLPKGARWEEEVSAASEKISAFQMTVNTINSITIDKQNRGGKILVLNQTR